MNFLQSISPIRGNSMIFQREKEGETQKSIKPKSTDVSKIDSQQSAEARGRANDNLQAEDLEQS